MLKFIQKPWRLVALAAILLVVCFISFWIVKLNLKPAKGGLQVITNEIPSSVFINGQYADKTPYINKELKPDTYNVRIQPDNPTLASHEMAVHVNRELLSVITWIPGDRPETSGGVVYEVEPLKSKKNTSELFIVSLPDGAVVTIDDATRDFTPLTMTDLQPGQHKISISLPSYETQTHTINALAGNKMIVTVKLAKSGTNQPTTTDNSQSVSSSPSAQITASSSATITNSVATTSASTNSQLLDTSTTASISGYVKILPTNFIVNGQEALRVRISPEASSAEVGFLPVGTVVPYLGEKKNGWHKIDFNGQAGWVSGQYVQTVESPQAISRRKR